MRAASIVSTTTAMNQSTPGPGRTDISGESCTSATTKVSTNTSSIDQRPTISTVRCRRVCRRASRVARRRTAASTTASAAILPMGISTLAMNTITARGQDPDCHRNTMPERMVSSCRVDSACVSSTGSTLAGM